MKWLDIAERRLRRFGIADLMTYVVAGMSLVFVANLVMPSINIYSWLTLSMYRVGQGELWRLITFVFLPPSASLIWIIFSLYFYWMIGSGLESEWGTTRFTLFYFLGIAGNILSALLTGYAGNMYLNLSLFLAFAALFPNFELRIFFVLPVKMKYLAFVDLAFLAWQFIIGGWSVRSSILLSLANVALFVGGDFINQLRIDSRYWKTRYTFRKAMRDRKRERQ